MSFSMLEKTTSIEKEVSCRGCKKPLVFTYPVEHVYDSDSGCSSKYEKEEQSKSPDGKLVIKKITVKGDGYTFHSDFVYLCKGCFSSKDSAVFLKVKKELIDRVIREHIRNRSELVQAHYTEIERLKEDLSFLEENLIKNEIKKIRQYRWHFMYAF